MDETTKRDMLAILYILGVFVGIVVIGVGLLFICSISSEPINFNKNAEHIIGAYTITDIMYENESWRYETHYPHRCEYEIVLNSGDVVGTYFEDLKIGKDYKMHILSGMYYANEIMWLEESNEIYEK